MTITLDEARERFGGELERRLMEAVAEGGDDLLCGMSTFHLETGGKRLRGMIPLVVVANLGGDPEEALEIGVALELLHNATLVHDDLQDGDEVRRGAPAIWARWGAAQAINTGDALYFHGLSRLVRAPAGVALVQPVSDAMLRVIAGQVMEFRMQEPQGGEAHLDPGIGVWETMARGKTGALFGACFYGGVLAATGDRDRADGAQRFGETLGLLFQVQDDYLDLVGDKGRGRRGSDLAEGKWSYPVAWVLSNGDPLDAASLHALVTTPREDTTDAMISDGLALLERTGAFAATATWLRETAASLEDGPEAGLVPGLVTRVLAPVAHAL